METPRVQCARTTTQCWGCRKQRLVCDVSLPECRKCKKNGKECPGYCEKKPLQWVERGKRKTEKKNKGIVADKKFNIDMQTPSEKRLHKISNEAFGSFSTFQLVARTSKTNGDTSAVEEYDTDQCIDQSKDAAQAWIDQQAKDGEHATMANLRCMKSLDVLPISSLSQWDVQLYHFYSSRTSLTLAGQTTVHIWQNQVYDDAKDYSFIMHSLLAVSALHVSREEPRRTRYFSYMASRHCELGVAKFRANVTHIDARNSRAFSLFSIFMAIFSLGVPSFRGFPAGSSMVSMILEMIGSGRRAWKALGSEGHKMLNGSLKKILNPDHIKPAYKLEDTNHDLLKDIEAYIAIYGETDEVKDIYLRDIHLLISSFWYLPSWAPFTDFLSWPMQLSDTFFEHMCARKPVPVFLLSYIMVPY